MFWEADTERKELARREMKRSEPSVATFEAHETHENTKLTERNALCKTSFVCFVRFVRFVRFVFSCVSWITRRRYLGSGTTGTV